jgi:hypothetical protein
MLRFHSGQVAVHQPSRQLSNSDVRHGGKYLSIETVPISPDRRRAQADLANLVESELGKHTKLRLRCDVST